VGALVCYFSVPCFTAFHSKFFIVEFVRKYYGFDDEDPIERNRIKTTLQELSKRKTSLYLICYLIRTISICLT
jgi:sulfur relay (sulfurtransferase) DsrC/TusE family protein